VTTISDVASLWPAWVFVAALLVWSLYHDTAYHRVLTSYGRLRASRGAADENWPSPHVAREFAVNPAILLVAGALAFVSAGLLGWATYVLAADAAATESPQRVASALACVTLVVVGVVLLRASVVRLRSPWHGVGRVLRRAVYASAARRETLLAEALALDPELKTPTR